MCALLIDEVSAAAPSAPLKVRVDDRPQTNSAALFWWTLLEEVAGHLPGYASLALCTTGSGRPDPEHLYPRERLERDLRTPPKQGFREAMQAILDDLRLFGPPASVELSVERGGERALWCSLPVDAIDADVFLYLLSWLLEWSGLPASTWDAEHVEGALRFASGALTRPVRFRLHNRHLAEGLYRRTVTLHPQAEGGARPMADECPPRCP